MVIASRTIMTRIRKLFLKLENNTVHKTDIIFIDSLELQLENNIVYYFKGLFLILKTILSEYICSSETDTKSFWVNSVTTFPGSEGYKIPPGTMNSMAIL